MTAEAIALGKHINHCINDPQDLNEALLGVQMENGIKEVVKRTFDEIEKRLLQYP